MEDLKLHLLLADDDIDDCDFFKEALDDIATPTNFTNVNDGVELMDFLSENQGNQPHVIFLDLNMPRKSGLECMEEIKASNTLNHIPIIIYSTSLDRLVVDRLYDMGAYHYIQKPGDFSSLKMVIKKAIALFDTNNVQPRSRDRFLILP